LDYYRTPIGITVGYLPFVSKIHKYFRAQALLQFDEIPEVHDLLFQRHLLIGLGLKGVAKDWIFRKGTDYAALNPRQLGFILFYKGTDYPATGGTKSEPAMEVHHGFMAHGRLLDCVALLFFKRT
jgi:hypothetical protein